MEILLDFITPRRNFWPYYRLLSTGYSGSFEGSPFLGHNWILNTVSGPPFTQCIRKLKWILQMHANFNLLHESGLFPAILNWAYIFY